MPVPVLTALFVAPSIARVPSPRGRHSDGDSRPTQIVNAIYRLVPGLPGTRRKKSHERGDAADEKEGVVDLVRLVADEGDRAKNKDGDPCPCDCLQRVEDES